MDQLLNRRWLLIAIAVLVILLAGALIWFNWGNDLPGVSVIDSGEFPLADSQEVPGAQSLFPDNTNPNNTSSSTTGIDSEGGASFSDFGLVSGKFKQIISAPIASATIFPQISNTIYYLDQATGNLYKSSLIGEGQERLSLTTLNNLRRVWWWGTNAEPAAIVGQEIAGQINLISASLQTASGTDQKISDFSGPMVPNNFYTFSVNPKRNKIVALGREKNLVSAYLINGNFNKPEKILGLSFGDWRLSWPEENLIAFETRPSSLIPGALYLLNLKTKSFDQIIAGSLGLTSTVSPNGLWVIYSESRDGKVLTYLLNLKQKTKTLLTFSTIADKCAWTSDGAVVYCAAPNTVTSSDYLDSWFKGTISSNDNFWMVNVASSSAKMVADTAKNSLFDVYKPFLDDSNETLFFTNKKDSSLWSFDVREGF